MPMFLLRKLSVLTAVALTFGVAPSVASAQSFSDAQRGEIEKIIKNYLITNPEILEEVSVELSKRQADAEKLKHVAAVKKHAEALFRSPRGVVIGNPDGDVNFVEFFDYNCGYCKQAMVDMMDMIKADPKLRVVLKEFPVLGQASVEAAQVGIALRMQDPSGKKYLAFHQKLLGGRGQADRARSLAAAKEAGADMARLEKDMVSPEIRATLEENLKMAEDIGLNGTPSYVIGEAVYIGAIGAVRLKNAVSTARCGRESC
jgi:protein-disulfide isomerase